MIFELIFLGVLTGFCAGFFGIGGGVFLVPSLMLISFDIKQAISISIMQMVFSSTYGTFLNFKNKLANLKDGLIMGVGGFLGGLQSGFILKTFSSATLQYLFICIVVFAIYKVGFAKTEENINSNKKHSNLLIFFLGAIVGAIAMSIGIGGSMLLVPVLVGFLHYNIKEATSLGLFFVIFSSIAGFLSLSFSGQMHYYEGAIVGLASLIGTFIGTKLKALAPIQSYKKYILYFYCLILSSMLYKTFI